MMSTALSVAIESIVASVGSQGFELSVRGAESAEEKSTHS